MHATTTETTTETPATPAPAILSDLDLYRALVDWASRRQGATALAVNTSCRRVYRCVCGSSTSESAKWRRTVHTQGWLLRHRDCLGEVVAEALRSEGWSRRELATLSRADARAKVEARRARRARRAELAADRARATAWPQVWGEIGQAIAETAAVLAEVA